MLDSMRDETYSSFCHMYALANVVCCNIRYVYPESKNPSVKRNELNVIIYPRVKTENMASILWSHTTNTDLVNDWQPNRFVLLIPERLICVKPNKTQPIQRKCEITNFFTKILCVAVGLDNTAVNVEKKNSIMTRVLVKNKNIFINGCPRHIIHNTANKAVEQFSEVSGFDVEDFLVDLFHWFDKSSKRKVTSNFQLYIIDLAPSR